MCMTGFGACGQTMCRRMLRSQVSRHIKRHLGNSPSSLLRYLISSKACTSLCTPPSLRISRSNPLSNMSQQNPPSSVSPQSIVLYFLLLTKAQVGRHRRSLLAPYKRLVANLCPIRKRLKSNGPFPRRGTWRAERHVHPCRQWRTFNEKELLLPYNTQCKVVM